MTALIEDLKKITPQRTWQDVAKDCEIIFLDGLIPLFDIKIEAVVRQKIENLLNDMRNPDLFLRPTSKWIYR